MLRRSSGGEMLRRALRRLKRHKALWWRPEIVRLSSIEGRLADIMALISSVDVGHGIDYMLSVLTEGGWISMDLRLRGGDVEDISIRYPAVLKGRRVSREELEEMLRRKYEAILRFDLAS
ncbi:MAG: hypothetical protein QI199_02145 [Candidatus Korarchaeota archaeon]|nr:hypothetical protein [Candidatus Korarchaeota archaeon]